MSKRAYGKVSSRMNGRSMWYGSSPRTLGTPGGLSQYSTGQRRAVATTVSDGSGFTAWGPPDAREERDVEDAVAARMAVGQVDPVLVRPLADGAQLARPPHEALVETAGIAPVSRLVRRGDEIVEAHGLGEGGDHVHRRRGRENQHVSIGPEGRQALRGEGCHQVGQGGNGPPPRSLHLLLAPATGDSGRGPDQRHGEEVLAQPVVDRVEQAIPGQGASGGQHPLLDQGAVEHLARGPREQGAVEIDEDRALGHGSQA